MPGFLFALGLLAVSPGSLAAAVQLTTTEQPVAGEIYAQAWVNGIDTGSVIELFGNADDLEATASDLRMLGIDAVSKEGPVRLRSITGLAYHLDRAAQVLNIEVAPSAMRRSEIAVTATQADAVLPAWGSLLNYSAYGDDTGNIGATGELRLFGPVGTVSSGVLVNRNPERRNFDVRRLETRYVFENLRSAQRLTIGDFISPDGSANGAIRAAGVQLATDFTLQPDLVTMPLPQLTGGNGVPSTVDLYVNGVRRLTQDVKAGQFAVSGVPMVDGAGQVSLLVRDALGRESVQQLSFYSSRQLLRPGLTATSAQVGLLRRNAFIAGDRYGAGFASGALRHGVSDRLTAEARLAVAGTAQVAGAGLISKLGEFGILAFSGDISHSNGATGADATISFRRDDPRMSAFIVAQKRFGKFETLANQRFFREDWTLQVGGAWRSPVLGGLSLSTTFLHSPRLNTRIIAASWSRSIGNRLSAFVNVVETRARRSGLLAAVGVTLPLSNRSSAIVQASHNAQGLSGAASWARFGEVDQGIDLRTTLSMTPDRATSLGGGLTFRGRSGEIGGDVQIDRRRSAGRVFASGAALWVGGRPELANAVGQSFVVVQTGQPNVAVNLENRPAGRTRSDGSLFLPNLPANATARIALDYDGIDFEHEVAKAEVLVRTRGAGGAVVKLPVRRIRAATIHILLPNGQPIPMGSLVHRQGRLDDMVGYEGIAYLTDIEENVTAEVEMGGDRCKIQFQQGTTDAVICHPL
ncbi:hypothetical protein ASE90_18495 [Sphingomonas sp. Leaf67]|uniref:fimbria/pilus outer membrane usher protein n=1 Tax=Sphingomonas sp. Leaf67 TaxID=1736230 RepID=UPI000700AB70|nr:fimbria/pilus outer membrane usher protein [Sphingomonas sp. Leaf67]KQN88866.1 hypothetical protein ASE90_18495 [Sphingomonas sp. Leaf67]